MSKKVIILDNKIVVITDSGQTFEKSDVDDDFIDKVIKSSEDELLELFCENYAEYKKEKEEIDSINKGIKNSKLLVKKGDSVYMESVSQLSVPKELVKAILMAETNNDETKLEAYTNFWTLMSLNPDERCRQNLFWFLSKYGMTIAKCGFFVGYRNVDKTPIEGVYTDYRTHSFKIKIGEMVTMPREECDTVQENTCSTGLHIAGKGWLKKFYFGNVGLACLVNPADVVAAPPYDNYGKLRTCAYLPMEVINYDENNEIIPLDVEDGFDCSYVSKVIYEGIMGTEEDSPYKIVMPHMQGVDKESITERLLDIAKNCIIERKLKSVLPKEN